MVDFRRTSFAFRKAHDDELPLYQFSSTAPVPQDYILRFPIADQGTTEILSGSEAVQQMGLWPGKDSVKRIGKTIVVRFSEG